MQSRFSDLAIEQTMEMARILQIPEEDILDWVEERKCQVELETRDILALLDKLRKNAVARNILANFMLYRKENTEGAN